MRRLHITLALTTLATLALPALAQTGQPRLNTLSPTGAKRGMTLEITLTGNQIGKTTSLLFEGEGIQATAIQIPKDRPNTAIAKVTLQPNALPGIRAVRAVTTAGVSDRQWFYVGAYPFLQEKEPNSSREMAQVLPSLPVTLSGTSDPAEDIDYFRFKGQAGQTYVMEVVAARLGSAFDSVLSVQDAQGRELAFNDDYYGSDSFLTFTPQKEGDYYISLRDLRFQGDGNHFYWLTVGAIPYLKSLFPLGATVGKPITLSLTGINIAANSTMQVTPVGTEGKEIIALPVPLPDGTVTTTPFVVHDGYELNESEPNDSVKSPHPIRIPCILNGRISPALKSKQPDIDNFAFSAEQGKKLVFEVVAKRLGSRLEPHISILNAQGNEIAVSDDQSTQRDTKLEFTPPATGTYIVQVRDLFFKGGEEYAYRLSIQEPTPSFRLSFPQDALNIGQGSRIAIPVNATRTNGFVGAISLEVQGLPEGVRILNTPQIPALRDSVVLVLEANAGAKLQGNPITLIGRATQGKQKLVRQATALETKLNQDNNPVSQPREFPVVSVMEGADISITTSLDSLTLAPGESKEIVLKITRRAGFNAKIPLSVIGAPAGITVTFAPVEIPEKQTEAKVTIKAEPNAPHAEFVLAFQGRITTDDPRPYYHSSVPILLTVKPAGK